MNVVYGPNDVFRYLILQHSMPIDEMSLWGKKEVSFKFDLSVCFETGSQNNHLEFWQVLNIWKNYTYIITHFYTEIRQIYGNVKTALSTDLPFFFFFFSGTSQLIGSSTHSL